ncbi:MAG: small, acid-soluble spore protein, alpha/beta type [Tissierellia bacterium]|nr:small, acid-soluble spore protein, alpha/beta type [Tissierellia bacterium]
MSNKKKTEQEIDENSLKFEIASELGLADKIRKEGWAGLTAKESGRIGGIITARKRKSKLNMMKKNIESS